jgi:transcription-repair coupling factor (superfamily II helicase)
MPAAQASPAPERAASPPPCRTDGAAAVALLRVWQASPAGLLAVAADERQAETWSTLLAAMAPDAGVLFFPAWDCLPYDRVPPSAAVAGARLRVLKALAEARPDRRPLVVASVEALLQKLPEREQILPLGQTLSVGDPVDSEALATMLREASYVEDDRVDEPGEIQLSGHVADIFPAGDETPARLDLEDGRISAIRRYDPLTQRSIEDAARLAVLPAREPPILEGRATRLTDWMPRARILLDARAPERHDAFATLVADSHAMALDMRAPHAAERPDLRYWSEGEWRGLVEAKGTLWLRRSSTEDTSEDIPSFAAAAQPARAFAAFVEAERKAGRLILLSADPAGLPALERRAGQILGEKAKRVSSWRDLDGDNGDLWSLAAPLHAGFRDPGSPVTCIAASDLLGSRAVQGEESRLAGLLPVTTPHVGDVVVHLDHGMAILDGLEEVDAGGGPVAMIRLRFAGEETLLVPASEFDRIWRYGASPDDVTLDRLKGTAWATRREALEAEIAQAARALARLASERARAEALAIVPPRAAYERLADRFPYVETPDQARTIADVLADLASGRPMDRLVCGDVGFGKTEVALRAAAAVALAGHQVALAAPTTVLVRQHLHTLRRRFAGTGLEIRELSRLVPATEAAETRRGIASGDVRIVVGTHALAGRQVRFADLGLMVIDEEQRFGVAQKEKLRGLGAAHLLALTATPIPRTFEAALAGLKTLSVIATPPARRRPIRTLLEPASDGLLREALLRERARGGQSFVVSPRIEDLEPLQQRLARLVPELDLLVGHAKLPPRELDDIMIRFAEGEADVLLSTSIVESGLDVPRANTILLWHPHRFGLAQLHQLRGRVGRGRSRGIAYLLTDPQDPVPAGALRRLKALVDLDRLGAGFAISARDLDLRGAGDLIGEDQAGHLKAIGPGLYRHLLQRALRAARGEPIPPDWSPEIRLGAEGGLIPADYMPETDTRIELLARLARVRSLPRLDDLADEIEDRFGPPPPPVLALLEATRLQILARELDVSRLDAGPQALALGFRSGEDPPDWLRPRLEAEGWPWRNGRLVVPRTQATEAAQAADTLRRLRDWRGDA